MRVGERDVSAVGDGRIDANPKALNLKAAHLNVIDIAEQEHPRAAPPRGLVDEVEVVEGEATPDGVGAACINPKARLVGCGVDELGASEAWVTVVIKDTRRLSATSAHVEGDVGA
jgi:hypothetical protein